MLIPIRKGYLVKAVNGKHLQHTLCGNAYRFNQVVEGYLALLDPFQRTHRLTAQSLSL